MASITDLIFVFSILEYGIVISRSSPLATENSPIPLSDLVEELRRESSDVRLMHLTYMFLAESYGDRVYNVSKNPSSECSTIMRATTIMLKKLAISEIVKGLDGKAVDESIKYLEGTKPLEEHPLESACKRIAKEYAENATLQVAFEKAKDEVAKSNVSSRSTYSQILFKFNSVKSVAYEMVDRYTVPEFARIMAVLSFVTVSQVTNPSPFNWFSPRLSFFAKSCQAVAAEEKFVDSMQSVFMKAVNDTISDIAVEDRQKRFKSYEFVGHYWWARTMMQTLYRYIASDATLKAELERKAASFSAVAKQEDLDFSKL